MSQRTRAMAQQKFDATQKKRKTELKERETMRLARMEKNARLKALRLARDGAPCEPEADSAETPKASMPTAHRHD
jgi:hypothetical protein